MYIAHGFISPKITQNHKKHPMKGYIVRLFSFVALIAMAAAMLPANAGGVSLSYTTPANGEIDTAAADGYATTTFSWNASGAYLTNDTITVIISPAPSSTANVQACTPAPATAFGGAGTLGGFSSTGATWTFSGNSAGGNGSLCLRLPVTDAGVVTTTNISVAILTSGTNVDYGALLYYIGGGNDVLVTATVPSTLSFAIVDALALTTPENNCALGTLTTGLVATCDYRLKISTNAAGGFTSTIDSDKLLSTPGYATITSIANDTAVTAGSEGYGIAVTGATVGGRDPATGLFDQGVTEEGTFSADDSPVPTAPTAFISYTDGFWSTTTQSTTLVEHKAAISPVTPAGFYSQTVTYTVTGSF